MIRRSLVLSSLLWFSGGCTRGALAPAEAPAADTARACSAAAFDAAKVERIVGGSTVLVRAATGSGSGFVIGEGKEQLVVTNHHVVANGGPFLAYVTLADGRKQTAPLEGVLASPDDDLALLRPASTLPVAPLSLKAEPARIGEPVAVVGYPGVSGSETSRTFEPGAITALERRLGASVFLQTNANINPGNSGGPLVDSCGRVLGIVNGKHRIADRVGLAVPAEALVRLLRRHEAPRSDKKAAVEKQMRDLLTEVRFRSNERAARYFGPTFVRKNTLPVLEMSAKLAKQKVDQARRELKRRGKDPDKMPKEAYLRELAGRLQNVEVRAMLLTTAMKERRLDANQAGQAFLGFIAAEQFGALDDLWLESTEVTKEGCANAYVTVMSKGGPVRYTLHLHEEWGQWQVQSLERVR